MKENLIELKREIIYNHSWRSQYPSLNNWQTTRQKITKDMEELSNTIKEQDIINIYTMLYLITAEHTFFSRVQGPHTKIIYTLGHKANLGKFKKH